MDITLEALKKQRLEFNRSVRIAIAEHIAAFQGATGVRVGAIEVHINKPRECGLNDSAVFVVVTETLDFEGMV